MNLIVNSTWVSFQPCDNDRKVRSRSGVKGLPRARWAAILLIVGILGLASVERSEAQGGEGFAFKIFRVESGLYPFVQVYFRTFDRDQQPLVNVNEQNIRIMVKGRTYDETKRQYFVESIRNRGEAVRTVLVIDCSKTMVGEPFAEALKATARFIDSKRPQDQVAVLAIRDTPTGYEEVSNFERDPAALARRIAELEPDGEQTRLYDTIGAAIQMCAFTSQGGITSNQAEYIISNSIVVFSDGNDEGSALSRNDLNTRISNLTIPIPIYSLAYTKIDPSFLLNLEALSKNSIGIFYRIERSYERLQKVVEEIQNILQSDYVITFRSYVPIDGEDHSLRVLLEWPSRSGKMTTGRARFESLESPPIKQLIDMIKVLNERIPLLKDPFMPSPGDF